MRSTARSWRRRSAKPAAATTRRVTSAVRSPTARPALRTTAFRSWSSTCRTTSKPFRLAPSRTDITEKAAPRGRLFLFEELASAIQPDVLEVEAVVEAVDHVDEAIDARLHAGR